MHGGGDGKRPRRRLRKSWRQNTEQAVRGEGSRWRKSVRDKCF